MKKMKGFRTILALLLAVMMVFSSLAVFAEEGEGSQEGGGETPPAQGEEGSAEDGDGPAEPTEGGEQPEVPAEGGEEPVAPAEEEEKAVTLVGAAPAEGGSPTLNGANSGEGTQGTTDAKTIDLPVEIQVDNSGFFMSVNAVPFDFSPNWTWTIGDVEVTDTAKNAADNTPETITINGNVEVSGKDKIALDFYDYSTAGEGKVVVTGNVSGTGDNSTGVSINTQCDGTSVTFEAQGSVSGKRTVSRLKAIRAQLYRLIQKIFLAVLSA